jgi:hypothetical protein
MPILEGAQPDLKVPANTKYAHAYLDMPSKRLVQLAPSAAIGCAIDCAYSAFYTEFGRLPNTNITIVEVTVEGNKIHAVVYEMSYNDNSTKR